MHSGDITIETVTKIEGGATVEAKVENGVVKDVKFLIHDYRRFYTKAVVGKPYVAVPPFLSRICGTCSVSHLFASLKAIENSQGIEVTEQTKTLRRLAYDALMIRDHTLHNYFFVLPDILGLDSILDIPDDHDNEGHQLLHDSFDIKQLGNDLSTAIIGAAIHAPLPAVGGFNKLPDPSLFPALIDRLEAIREKVIRGVKVFYDWRADFKRNSDYIAIRGKHGFDFLEGDIVVSGDNECKTYQPEQFREFLETVVIPYSHSEGYKISETNEDYLVGSLARLNLNLDQIHPRTKNDIKEYLNYFPSDNIYDQDLAQQIETLHCVDDAIDILKNLKIIPETPVKKPFQVGVGVGAVEAPRGTLYHKAEVDEKGIITNYDVIVPTAQNQVNIENDLKQYFNDHIDKSQDELKFEAEKIIRCYDPCMSCATNFLKLKWIKE